MRTCNIRAPGRLAALAVAGVAAGGLLSLATTSSALAGPVASVGTHTVSTLQSGGPEHQQDGSPGMGGFWGFPGHGGFWGFPGQGGFWGFPGHGGFPGMGGFPGHGHHPMPYQP